MKNKKSEKNENIDFKIFSNIKTEKERCIKICGFKIYEEISNEIFRIQKFCGNLLCTKKLYSTVKERKVLKILNFPVSERIIENDVIQHNLFNKPIKKIHLPDIFYKKYLKNVHYDYDDVYILHANSGEAYLFFAYCVKSFLRKNNSKKPLFLATQDYHIDILKMYLPEANVVYIKNFYLRTKSDKWFTRGHNCYIVFSANHFYNLEKDTCKKEIGQIHYLNSINKTLDISEKDYTKPVVNISQDVKQNLAEKIKPLYLNLDNFVIIAPEAKTCEELPVSLWKDIVKELQKRGCDIFLNIVDNDNYIEGCKSVFLTYQEIFELAKHAKAVLSLRSGLTEFLLPTEIPNITVYTKFKEREKFAFSVAKTISAYSMHKFPFINHDIICELNIDDFDNEENLLKTIFENFDRMVNKRNKEYENYNSSRR